MPADGVSFIVACKDQEPTLPRAVGSARLAADALARVGVASEVIVADAGSRDGTAALVRQLEARYGVRAVRGAGLPVARHRAAFLLGAAEWLEPANAPLFLRALRDTGAAAVYGNVFIGGDESPDLRGHESLSPRALSDDYVGSLGLCDVAQCLDAGLTGGWRALAVAGRRVVHVPVVAGHADEWPAGAALPGAGREGPPMNSRHLRYHPDVGWL